jgi:hypothetical protein
MLIAESLELNDAHGGSVLEENALVIAVLVSALLGERDQALALSAQAFERRLSSLVIVCVCFEATAEAIARRSPGVAAVLHGAVDALVPTFAQGEPAASLRERSREAISTRLDEDRVAELYAQGAEMTEDEATAYALDAIARVPTTDPR